GILAEVLGDVAFAVAPLDERDALQLVDALEHQNLLDAFRGEAAADRAKLAAILQALGQIGIERPEVRSIDLNPLILEGSDPIVVDALVELEAQPGDGA
ncbi:MAG: acetate--CoA ligase family protein, partial [Myxococcales bacterium]|nr:acetate--CoA ligase family protein [Myxococcales bacterium]